MAGAVVVAALLAVAAVMLAVAALMVTVPALVMVLTAVVSEGVIASEGDVLGMAGASAAARVLADDDQREDRGGDQHPNDGAALRTRIHQAGSCRFHCSEFFGAGFSATRARRQPRRGR